MQDSLLVELHMINAAYQAKPPSKEPRLAMGKKPQHCYMMSSLLEPHTAHHSPGPEVQSPAFCVSVLFVAALLQNRSSQHASS